MSNTTLTFVNTSRGEFSVLLNGEPTNYAITNGSAGVSGHGRNNYLVIDIKRANAKPDDRSAYRPVGSLANAKKIVALAIRTAEKRAASV